MDQANPGEPAAAAQPTQLPLATLRARAAAAVFDAGALYALLLLAVFAIHSLFHEPALTRLAERILFFAAPWLYFAGFESSAQGATPGKMRRNLVVTDARGGRISFARASVRFVGKLPMFATLGLALVPALFDPQRRGLDDWLAGTRVRVSAAEPDRKRARSLGRAAGLAAAALILSFMGYFYYSLVTGKERVTQLCSQIRPGMRTEEVAAFARRHGLGPGSPKAETRLAYLAEMRSYGRHACKVEFESGAVVRSTYNYAD